MHIFTFGFNFSELAANLQSGYQIIFYRRVAIATLGDDRFRNIASKVNGVTTRLETAERKVTQRTWRASTLKPRHDDDDNDNKEQCRCKARNETLPWNTVPRGCRG